MGLSALPSFECKATDGQLVLNRAIQDAKGNVFDIAIVVNPEGQCKAVQEADERKIQMLVCGCLEALRNQIKEKVDPCQLGFIVKKSSGSGSPPVASRAIVAQAGQTALERFKKCQGHYGQLDSFGDTGQMKMTGGSAKTVAEGLGELYNIFDRDPSFAVPPAADQSSKPDEGEVHPQDRRSPVVPDSNPDRSNPTSSLPTAHSLQTVPSSAGSQEADWWKSKVQMLNVLNKAYQEWMIAQKPEKIWKELTIRHLMGVEDLTEDQCEKIKRNIRDIETLKKKLLDPNTALNFVQEADNDFPIDNCSRLSLWSESQLPVYCGNLMQNWVIDTIDRRLRRL